MGEVGRVFDLVHETLYAEDGGVLGTQNLDGYATAMLQVFGELDGGHAAGTQLAFNVAVSQRGFQAFQQVSHG